MTTPPAALKKTKRVSMQAIAHEAGVSTATVSLALRDDKSISEATRDRIKAIQQSVGYQFKARRKRSKSSHRPPLEQIIYRTVGVDMREENYAPFLEGIVTECRHLNITLELDNIPSSHFAPIPGANSALLSKRGIVISGRITSQTIRQVEESGLPYVVLGNYFLEKPTHMVGINLDDISRRLMHGLVLGGMKRTIFFVEVEDRPIEREFLHCMRFALEEMGIPKEKTSVVEGGLNFQRMEAAVAAIGKQLVESSRVVTIEKHCAEALSLAWRSFSRRKGELPLTSFVATRPRLPLAGCKAFDLGLEQCGRLAVARLAELQRAPGIPLSQSYIYSPGWLENY